MRNYQLPITDYQLRLAKILCVLCVLCGATFSVFSQSTNPTYPTPITTNEIYGKIPARDVGDARLTSFYYVFNAIQGDVFVNLKTSNLDGDIDIFTAENLRPLSKIKVFSDVSENETGRVIYLRKPEKLILRIEGRSPNDNPASFSLKFAGSFVPALVVAKNDLPELPEVKIENQGDVIVNSVGTIIGIKPKPTPKETVAKNEPPKNKTKKTKENAIKETKSSDNKTNAEIVAENAAKEPYKVSETARKPEVVETENVPKKEIAEKSSKTIAPTRKRGKIRTAPNKTPSKTASAESKIVKEPNPLEKVHLLILFKDGTKIERPMSEVLRVGVDRGVLTLITRDGATARYQILDVAKMTIE